MAASFSKPEHVADLHEELAAVIEIATGGVGHVAGRQRSLPDHVQVLQVAVVTDIDRRPRMYKVSDEEVGVEFPLRRQIGIRRADAGRSGEQRVVLQDHAGRELRSELPVPFTANDVVVEDASANRGELRSHKRESIVGRAQMLEQVGVLDFQRLHGTQRQTSLRGFLMRDERVIVGIGGQSAGGRESLEVWRVSPVIGGKERRLLEVAGLE